MPVASTGARRRPRRRCIVDSDLHYYGSIKHYAICNDYTLCPIVQLFELLEALGMVAFVDEMLKEGS